MSGPAQKSDTERRARRLVDHLVGPPELGPPRAVLATTFDLQPDFVETDFLPSLLRLPSWDDRKARSRIVLEGELAKMEAVALMMEGRRYRGRPRSLRVHLAPASRRGPGALHAKVIVLVHDDAVRMLVGSANLTTAGFRENREVALSLRADGRRGAGALVRQALEAMPAVLEPWWDESAERVRELALAKLDTFGVSETLDDEWFAWSDGGRPLLQQLLDVWPANEVVERIRIVSPFWSEEDGQGPLASLVARLRERGCAAKRLSMTLIAAASPESSTRTRPMLPASFGTFDFRSVGVDAFATAASPQIDKGDVDREDLSRERRLHAKVILLEGPRTSVAYIGSANCSSSGWGLAGPLHSNIEAGVILRRRLGARAQLAGLLPPTVGELIPLSGAAARSLAVCVSDEEETSWPLFLKELSLRPSEQDRLELELHASYDSTRLPGSFSIAAHDELLCEFNSNTIAPSLSGEVHIQLTSAALNALLRRQVALVRWTDSHGNHESEYPINVALEARERLPFGDPDQIPDEDALLSFYQGRISFEDAFPTPADEEPVVANSAEVLQSPVDTTRILSYQIRSFVEALHGIRGELERCTETEAAMRLALLGPVSPLALARHIRAAVQVEGRSPTAAGFQLVELLSCLEGAATRHVDDRVAEAWRQACEDASTQIERLLSEVRTNVAEMRKGSQFDRYARAILASAPGKVRK